MRKLILGILTLSLMLVMIGSVSAVPTTLFEDNFSGDLSQWTVVNSPTIISESVSFNGDGSGLYDGLFTSIDTTGEENIEISYYRNIVDTLESDDYFYVEYSVDGSIWIPIETLTEGSISGTNTFNFPADANDISNLQIRFRIEADAPTGDEVRIDDVIVTEEAISPVISPPIVSPPNPKTTDTVSICADVIDDGSGVKNVRLDCTSIEHGFWSSSMGNDGGNQYCTGFFITDVEDDEEMFCSITAEDNNGNPAIPSNFEYTYDGENPIAEFTCIPLSGDEPLTTVCTSTSTDTVSEHEDLIHVWDYSGGNLISSTDDSITVEYLQQGDYIVTLTVTDEVGFSDTEIKTDYISVLDTDPIAEFTSDSPKDEGSVMTFTDESESYDGITTWAWDFDNDGIIDSTEQNPTHTYNDDGDYTVTLTVTEEDGSTDSVSNSVHVDNVPPIANPNGSYNAVINQSVVFTGSATDVVDTVFSYQWDFDYDGITFDIDSTLQNPSAVYSELSEYTIALRVNDGDDDSEIVTTTVTVYDYQISLTEGWNLISIPLVPEEDDTSVNSVLGDIKCNIDTIWAYQYDEVTGKNKWDYKTVNESCEWNDGQLEEIIPGYGYYIKMNEIDELYQNGKRMYGDDEIAPRPPVVTLTPSWNLIGHYGTEQNIAKAEALDTLADSYSTLLDKDGHSVSEMNPKEGYWLFVTGTDSLDYAPSDAAYP